MKCRQAKKIILRERAKGIHGYYGCLGGSPSWVKALHVYTRNFSKEERKRLWR